MWRLLSLKFRPRLMELLDISSVWKLVELFLPLNYLASAFPATEVAADSGGGKWNLPGNLITPRRK